MRLNAGAWDPRARANKRRPQPARGIVNERPFFWKAVFRSCRRAHHREQPRRQRDHDQLRRELSVRHTGSDRWRRLPVPREQHRHEQLQPLQRHTRAFSRARTLGCGIPRILQYAVSTLEAPVERRLRTRRLPRRAVRTLSGRRAGAPPSAVAGWPQLDRPAKPKRDIQTAKPGKKASREPQVQCVRRAARAQTLSLQASAGRGRARTLKLSSPPHPGPNDRRTLPGAGCRISGST